MSTLRSVFFGTPTFAAYILDFLITQKTNIIAVVTKPDKPGKRSKELKFSPVKKLALEKLPDIPLFQPLKASAEEFAKTLRELKPDLFLVAAYGEIFKENLLQMPRVACINVHASLLPKYRGAAPIPRAILAGEKQTGVTIMSMKKELDAGAVLSQVKIPIDEQMNTGELTEALSKVGAEALWKIVQAFEKGKVSPIEQDSSAVTYAPRVKDEEGYVEWNKDGVAIHNQIRAMTPNPGAWTYVLHKGVKKRLLIGKASLVKDVCGEPGTILASSADTLVIGTVKYGISFLEVQLEGKKRLPIADFLRGVSKKDLSFTL